MEVGHWNSGQELKLSKAVSLVRSKLPSDALPPSTRKDEALFSICTNSDREKECISKEIASVASKLDLLVQEKKVEAGAVGCGDRLHH